VKIYTKTGDKGETGIIGKRLSKSSKLIDTIGTLDELNASIGIALIKLQIADFKKEIETLIYIQNSIFDLGAVLANGKTERDFSKLITKIEKNIDNMDAKLPKLQNFILPGGSEASAYIHLSRTICRRAERYLVDLLDNIDFNYRILPNHLKFINRLSDYLFILARYTNFKLGCEDILWNNNK